MREKGFLACILAAFIAGSGGVYINSIGLDAKSIAWMRHAVPSILLVLVLLFQRVKLFTGDKKAIFWISAVSALRIYLFVLAYVYTNIGNAVVVFYTYPIFTVLFAYKILKEPIERRQVFLMFVAFAGLIVIYWNKEFSFENNDFLGMLFALGASVSFAYIVILMKQMNQVYGRVEVLFYQNFLGALVFIPFFFIDLPVVTGKDLGFGLLYGVVIGISVYYLFLYGLKRMKASLATSLMYLEVPSTIFLGWLFLEEELSLYFIVGAAMIVFSSLMLRLKKKAS